MLMSFPGKVRPVSQPTCLFAEKCLRSEDGIEGRMEGKCKSKVGRTADCGFGMASNLNRMTQAKMRGSEGGISLRINYPFPAHVLSTTNLSFWPLVLFCPISFPSTTDVCPPLHIHDRLFVCSLARFLGPVSVGRSVGPSAACSWYHLPPPSPPTTPANAAAPTAAHTASLNQFLDKA